MIGFERGLLKSYTASCASKEAQTFIFYLYKTWFRTSNGDLFAACLTPDHMHLMFPHLSNYLLLDYNLILINNQNDGPNDDML